MLEQYIVKNQKVLRYGYTTGTCTALAAKAAAQMLFTQCPIMKVDLTTPKGFAVIADVLYAEISSNSVSCAIKKDSGDDPDVTNGILLFAEVKKSSTAGIHIDGGIGVGRITRKGLEQPVGSAAINRVPREMIAREVLSVCECFCYGGGLSVTISIPRGAEIAKKTFNPRLGIEGGLSVLGTSGIVEPMSEQALTDTIRIEMKQLSLNGVKAVIATPGNYGEAFLKTYPQLENIPTVKCSNFIGDTLDYSSEYNFEALLLVGHIGKLIKLAAGIMNTHSKYADGRMEILAAHAALAGADRQMVKEILEMCTTDEAVDFLESCKLLQPVLNTVMERIQFHINARTHGQVQSAAIMFSNQKGLLYQTKNTNEVLTILKRGS